MNDAAGAPARSAQAAVATSPMLFDTLRTASGHAFGRATLNAPATLNALSLPMIDLLAPQLAAWAEDPAIAGVVLDAVGDRAFCSGGDVIALHQSARALRADPANLPGTVPPEAAVFFEREYRLDYAIHTYPKPLLAWGHGIVMGGGMGLMVGASHRVVTPQSRLAMPEVTIGLFPDVGGSWFLPRLPGRAGLFLALTGAPLNAADACYAGLAEHLLPHAAHAAVLQDIAAERWDGAQTADAARLTQLLRRRTADDAPASPLRAHLARIDGLIAFDALPAIAPRLGALRGDGDAWLARAAEGFATASPTSLALSCELQRRTRNASLADVFRLEFQAALGCCAHHDFIEGIRALLVDRDRKPRWDPATLAEVSPAWIDAHLVPRHAGAHPLADLH